jgi:hypothetical protein
MVTHHQICNVFKYFIPIFPIYLYIQFVYIYIYIERERVVGISCYYGKDHAGLKIHFNTYSKYKSYEYI